MKAGTKVIRNYFSIILKLERPRNYLRVDEKRKKMAWENIAFFICVFIFYYHYFLFRRDIISEELSEETDQIKKINN